MTLTEKVRSKLGGYDFRVFEVTGISATGTIFSMGALGMNYVNWATYTPTKATLSAGSTTLPVLKTAECSAGGLVLTLSGVNTSADSGVLTIWGN